MTNPPPWQRLFCVGDYHYPLSGYIRQLKHQNQPQLARDLSWLLAKQIPSPAPFITSVPLHWQRQLKRGFNQSALLSTHLTRHLNQSGHQVRCDNRLFRRIKATQPQQTLDKQQRLRNLNGVFRLNHKPAVSHIAIVDDVVTTGSTLRYLCQQLLDIGIESIDIYCICRTPEPSSSI
jgi:ComF family protein